MLNYFSVSDDFRVSDQLNEINRGYFYINLSFNLTDLFLEQIRLAVERERVDEANAFLRVRNEEMISEGKWNGWTIVIQVHNRLDLLKECLSSIEKGRV